MVAQRGQVLLFAVLSLLRAVYGDLLSCCDHADSDNACHSVCVEIFHQVSDLHSLTPNQFQDLTTTCSSTYHQMWACVNQTTAMPTTSDLTPTEVTQVTTPENFYCCDRALSRHCIETCKANLGLPDEASAIQRVIEACGPPPSGPLWECFLSPTTDPPELEPVNVDWARIQCCHHASARECRDSCIQLYSGIISSYTWQTLQLDCIHRPSEVSLATCLNDVSAPCKLGCSGLHFCRNFNNRPTMAFRQCSTAADHMAKNDFYTWSNYGIIYHPLTTVVIKNTQTCHPELWKALACNIHIQPCHPATHATQICRDDCIRLLSDCNNSTYSANAICDIITPASSSDDNCLSLSTYTKPSPHTKHHVSLITNPCDPNPCKQGFFCSINHLCRLGDLACSHYICQPGCIVGDSPSLIYPGGSRIKVPVEMLSSENDEVCFGYFNCTIPSAGGEVQVVSGSSSPPPSHHCESESHCYIGENVFPHLSHFHPDSCNLCTCFYGRMKCTNLTCQNEGSSTYVNCDCARVYQPVCTVDGQTLPNMCIASCLGYKEDEYKVGDCNTFNPCSGHTCGPGSRCMPSRRVCLLGNTKECTQHTCEPLLQTCSGLPTPVCDASNSQHSTLCNFLRTQEDFGYHGYCREDCSRIRARPVCGVNGETFETICHAESLHIAVDYHGPCKAVPGSGPDESCEGVVCPVLSHSTCVGVTPWSACCPKCGGHLTILMDEVHLDINSNALGQEVLSSVDIVGRLRTYISSLQCDLYGHVVADGSLSVLVLPVINASAPVVIEACNQEATKLATFINNRTPMLASDPILSHLIAAEAQTSYVQIQRQSSTQSGSLMTADSAHHSVFSVSLLSVFTSFLFALIFGNIF